MTENISVSVYKDKPKFCNNANLRTIFITSDQALLIRIKGLGLTCYDVNLCENSTSSKLLLLSNNPLDYDILNKNSIDYIDVDVEFIYNAFFTPLDEFGFPTESEIHYSTMDDDLFSLFLHVTETISHKIEKDLNDRYSVPVNNALKFPFQQYLSENVENKLSVKPLDFIYRTILEKKKIIIQALAGTGKSTSIVELINNRFDSLVHLGIRKIIVIEPTTSITKQLWEDVKSKHKMSYFASEIFYSNLNARKDPYPYYNGVGKLYNGARQKEKEFAIYDSIITIACIDSFNKIPKDIIESSLIIVDEFHQLVNDYDYRNKEAFNLGWEKIQLAKRIVLMSATPNYYFCSNLHKSFNYQLIHFQPEVKSKINLKPIVYKGKEKDLPYYAYQLADAKKDGMIFGKFDSKKNLEACYEYFNSLGVETEFFHSGNSERKEKNKNYTSLMETGFVPESIKMLWSTSLLEAGVSIKNKIKFLFLVDCKCYQKAIQIINRPRINSEQGINTTLDVALFRSQYSEKNIKKRKFVSVDVYFHTANKICYALNLSEFNKTKTTRLKLPNDINFGALWYQSESNEFKVNPLGILHEMYKGENNSSLEIMLNRMVKFDDRINLEAVQFVTNNEIEQVKEIRSNLLENEKFNKEYLERLLVDDYTRYETIKAIIFMSKDMDFKKASQLTHEIKIIDKNDCLDFIKEHKQAFVGTNASKILKNINFLMDAGIKKNLSSKEAVQILNNTDEAEMRLSKNRMIAQERQNKLSKNPESLNPKDLFNADINKKTILRINELNRKKRKENEYGWTAENFKKIINKCRKKFSENSNFKPVTNDTALSLIRTFFQVASKTKRMDGKKVRFYKIVRKIKGKNIAEKLSKKG